MKNIDIFVHEKYNKADYEKVAEHIYKEIVRGIFPNIHWKMF